MAEVSGSPVPHNPVNPMDLEMELDIGPDPVVQEPVNNVINDIAPAVIHDIEHESSESIGTANEVIQYPGETKGVVNTVLGKITSMAAIGASNTTRTEDAVLRQVMLDPTTMDPHGHVLQWVAEPLEIKSGDRTLEGIYFQSTSDKSVENVGTKQNILICSGSHKSFEHYTFPMVQALTEMGHNVMCFNYSGFGRSEGSASEKHVYQDSMAAFDKLAELTGNTEEHSKMKVIGFSLGTAAAAWLGTEKEVDVVLDRSLSHMKEPVGIKLKRFHAPTFFINLSKVVYKRVTSFNSASRINDIKGRCQIVYSHQDPMSLKAAKIFRSVIDRTQMGARQKYHFNPVDAFHEHDKYGARVREGLPDSFPAEEGQEPVKVEAHQELWYSNTEHHQDQFNALDEWLRTA
ncbi:MAG: alpha/beta hydrolase [Chlamydiales bacterium]|nr:alpha/beta hydrolase [Chlamydiales bacterium]